MGMKSKMEMMDLMLDIMAFMETIEEKKCHIIKRFKIKDPKFKPSIAKFGLQSLVHLEHTHLKILNQPF